MRCPAKTELTPYLLGDLARADYNEVADHLENCRTCQDTIASLGTCHDSLIEDLQQSSVEPDKRSRLHYQRAVSVIRRLRPKSFVPTAGEGQAIIESEFIPPPTLREYELREPIGCGGMGAVYRAFHTRLRREVALKILRPERIRSQSALNRFEQEMEAVAPLDHPNLVRATDAGEIDGIHFLVMELVPGLNLAELVRRADPLPIAEACEIGRQAAEGLAHSHAAG